MPAIWMMIGAVCLLYFLMLFVKQVDFCIIWLLIAAVFLVTGGYWSYRIKHPNGWYIPNKILIIGGVAAVISLILFLGTEYRIIKEMYRKPESDLTYLIVLGAQVKGTEPSRALRMRLEETKEYLEENPDTKAVLSGGQGPGEAITEAACMYQYLTGAGIEKERLLLENRSTSTLENLQYSSIVIEEDAKQPAFKQKVGLLSNNFHIYRALRLGESMGYENLYGVPAKSDWRLQVHYLVREFFALIKEQMTGAL